MSKSNKNNYPCKSKSDKTVINITQKLCKVQSTAIHESTEDTHSSEVKLRSGSMR